MEFLFHSVKMAAQIPRFERSAMDVVRHVIDGAEVDSASGRTFASHDPAGRGQLADVAFGEAEDVARAVAAARRADAWARVAPAQRAFVLRAVATRIREQADDLAALESADSGKPLTQAAAEIIAGAELFETFSGLPELPAGRVHPAAEGYFVYSKREPYGVVGAIAPWNFPFLLACWKVAPALAVGNRVVLKMAEQTPLSSARLGRLCLEAGMPAGVLNVVNGDGPTTGHALVVHPDVPKITFTGSTTVGREILRHAADRIKSVHLELGGKTPNIVFADAPREDALAGSLFTSFHNAGQICTTGSRLLVDERIADEFTDALVQRASALPVGDPRDPATRIGPLVSGEQLARVTGYVERGLEEGATLLCGGGPPDGAGDGHYLAPTVFGDVTPQMRIAQEEIFGPVLSVMTFAEEDAAVALANDVMYGLAATVWTNDLGRAFRLAERLEAGIVWTNCPHFLPFNVPYEGHKMSGLGEDLGVEAAATFTRLKTHLVGHTAQPPRID
jgi:acyl-CoA reductase-like NAD-dependent aldehyde dehydrogenase